MSILYHTLANKSRRKPCILKMMHRLRRYDVFRVAQNDGAPVGRNDAMFAQCAVRHTSFAQRTSLGEAVIICRRQTSFKKRTFVGRQKCVFCCLKREKRSIGVGKTEKRSTEYHIQCRITSCFQTKLCIIFQIRFVFLY